MPKKSSPCLDQPEPGRPPVGPADQSKLETEGRKQRNGETTASSSPESGSVNGDVKRSGKSRRRRKRSSNPDNGPEGKAEKSKNNEEERADKRAGRPSDKRDVLMSGLKSECAHVWLERSLYERAESLYQRWLASSSNGATRPSGKFSNSNLPANKKTFERVDHRFVEESAQPSVPNSLNLPPPSGRTRAPRTPDDGYQSLAPTPATPATPGTPMTPVSGTPAVRQSINGLPRIAAELLRGVWLDKPRYDRAEAAFYQNLYGNNSSKRAGGPPRSSGPPQSLVEEEEEEDEDTSEEGKPTAAAPPAKADVFHALLPIQEEEEPADAADRDEAAGVRHFLHPDSERVWTDRRHYEAAESRLYSRRGGGEAKACPAKRSRRSDASSSVPSPAPRDKKMSALDFLAQERIWFDKPRYDEAERRFYERVNGSSPQDVSSNNILQDIARARENIQKSLAGPVQNSSSAAEQAELVSRIKGLELENSTLHKVVGDLRAALSKLESRVAVLEKPPPSAAAAPVAYTNGNVVQKKTPVKDEEEEEEDDDDDMDLFGSDDDDEAEKLKEQRIREYAQRKAKKPALIAKSSILLDVKPWDDETDMSQLETCVRSGT
ncbi:eukaryotic translation elongation factor 1 delta b (guanine nucleotide exchange protein) isoform X3 [Cololabis saira]|uniref:eukaryotic translation elongation factor 1 delta b (guanine nucleotide exchange protein) isoform X3 n=1 Tax=Cololabis saira TaxID=129043 RepID=UPI002AD4F809|nr:eukaryotic translation elongation factor 1 delta b (guanine nucleotide exchange protein) isoform X3 [Cololabis saira]